MKCFSTAILASLFATVAYAQNIVIAAPVAQSSVTPGESIRVQVNVPDSLSPSTEVAVVIAMIGCTTSPAHCPAPSEQLGNILYNGVYSPTLVGTTKVQNFTVTVPSGLKAGQAVLSVSHFNLIGVSSPFLFGLHNEMLMPVM
ncbi:hypothetical protein FIBSPDRAFT_851375 [Athelia psychrophila]|uniref:Phosphatidylglycerol/phosphatidylinositol transfer protein n=1 Tax=Athelia psychrophila TaxID=1759441 RepID=A0A166SSF3_9AGAM|nr:hypothetical protein FIBSPDRAFT_851375 [Fibularhizoctonia sp. CBS 109695]